MPDLDTAAIKARLDAATPWPWEAGERIVWSTAIDSSRLDNTIVSDGPRGDGGCVECADAELIAHAPSDIAALLAENERLAAALKQVREALSEHLEAVQTFATMPAVGDHGDTRWGEGYKRASEHEVNALKPVLAIVTTALDGAHPTERDGSGTDG